MTWVVPPEWLGETVFVLGCGPSLASTPVGRLSAHGRVIAINDAYRRLPTADVLYFCDRKWWLRNQSYVRRDFQGRYIVTIADRVDGVKTLRCTGAIGLESDPGALRHGSNSGYQAINLAYHFGARRIVLLGYDMRLVEGKVHWKARSKEQPDAQRRTMENVMLPKFDTLKGPLEKAGVEVLNATPRSRLRVWPLVDIDEIL